ncbi:acylneuraminate cytidylyltransferase family protein [Nocardioides koreensis]|uniref:acylneuraminate cytidylyltransferase family protein n=1 Tax=Nocardioides koreensis TaxID=433651 RepID=UPI0031D00576
MSAVVPMRHSSERVRGKNYRDLGGVPLFHHVVRALLATPSVAEVIIDTDSQLIMSDAAQHFPSVKLVERPEHLRDGHTPMNDVLENTMNHAVEDVLLQTHSTNPFVRPATFEAAIRMYFESEHCDSVFGVTQIQGRLWSHDVRPLNHDPKVLARTQDLDPVYFENSCVYVFSKETLQSTGNRLGVHPLPHAIDAVESIDIDEESDFKLAEAVEAAGLMGAS